MKLAATMQKDALLLWRDRWGLAILALMPTVLVVVLTLAQEGALQTIQASTAAVLWVDEDGQSFGREVREGLWSSGYFQLFESLDGRALTRETAIDAVARGTYKVCVLVAKGASARLRKGVERLAEAPAGRYPDPPPSPETLPGLDVLFDPQVPDSYRRAVTSGVARVAQGVEMRWLVRALQESLAGPYGASSEESEGVAARWKPGRLATIREGFAGPSAARIIPTAVQQNVPGWTLFAMFLVAIPLSCSIIRERDTGTLLRLRMLPVSYFTILVSKVLTYLVFCLVQFALILLLGLYGLPLLGAQPLALGSHPVALVAPALASGLAATSFGILVGSVARTTDQATIFGSTFAVIAGAIGGIMVPVFLMPRAMQLLSPLSPIRWGHSAFLAVFLRGAGWADILPDLSRLLAFAAACVAAAVLWLGRREGSPIPLPGRLGRGR
ncbi:MAG: ABC transporter permease [Deltaproteobacteria bacterium]|nr:ABC transporter permease [Deltaproteobacteria bacterium]